jgi:hypothetical protein
MAASIAGTRWSCMRAICPQGDVRLGQEQFIREGLDGLADLQEPDADDVPVGHSGRASRSTRSRTSSSRSLAGIRSTRDAGAVQDAFQVVQQPTESQQFQAGRTPGDWRRRERARWRSVPGVVVARSAHRTGHGLVTRLIHGQT